MRVSILAWCLVSASLLACVKPLATRHPTSSELFFDKLSHYCGQAFAGKLAAFNENDAKSFGGGLVMHVRSCSENEIRIPFQAGNDRSRTWVITKTGAGLRLKHEHRHEDGSEDPLSQYGGDTMAPGSENRREFPADAFSRAMFERGGMQVSMQNVWALELTGDDVFAYELRRPDRHFRVEFDLRKPVAIPPPAWGFTPE